MNHYVQGFTDIYTHIYNYYKYFGLNVSYWFCTVLNPVCSGFPGKPWLLFAFLCILLVQRQLIMNWRNPSSTSRLSNIYFQFAFSFPLPAMGELDFQRNLESFISGCRCFFLGAHLLISALWRWKWDMKYFHFCWFFVSFPRSSSHLGGAWFTISHSPLPEGHAQVGGTKDSEQRRCANPISFLF